MTTIVESVSRLVRALGIEPASRRHTALVLAGAQNDEHGVFAATMADIAAWTGLSKNQARKHVHSLISMGVLRVVANAHGGSPLDAPLYQFVASRLRDLAQDAGATPDLFEAPEALPHFTFDGELEDSSAAVMLAVLSGRPGRRIVSFIRQSDDGPVAYGHLTMQAVLLPLSISQEWAGGWLAPDDGAPAWASPVFLPSDTAALIQSWAQFTALGRIESVETA